MSDRDHESSEAESIAPVKFAGNAGQQTLFVNLGSHVGYYATLYIRPLEIPFTHSFPLQDFGLVNASHIQYVDIPL